MKILEKYPGIMLVIGILLFHEIPNILQIIGGLIILGGVIYYSRLPDVDL